MHAGDYFLIAVLIAAPFILKAGLIYLATPLLLPVGIGVTLWIFFKWL